MTSRTAAAQAKTRDTDPRAGSSAEALKQGIVDHLRCSLGRPVMVAGPRDYSRVLADYAAYVACQERVSAAWADAQRWTHMSVLNSARCGKFSSDRAIREYCDEIWGVAPVPVPSSEG